MHDRRPAPVAALASRSRAVLLALLPLARSADAGPPGGRGPPRRQRPNIVLVVLDDFSMDLLQTLRSARAMRAPGRVLPRTRSSSTRCAASRGRAPSPGSTPTRPACAPTSPTRPTRRTRAAGTPPSPGSATASARWRCGCRRRATRRGTSASTSTSTSTSPADPCRPRRPAGTTCASSSAPPTTAGSSTAPAPSTGGRRSATTRRRRRTRRREAKDAAYAGTVIGTDALEFIDAPRGRRGAVLPPGGALRPAQPRQRAAALRR